MPRPVALLVLVDELPVLETPVLPVAIGVVPKDDEAPVPGLALTALPVDP